MTRAQRLVCVIDNDLSMRTAVGRLLESEDYPVEIFTGAQEFLARVPAGFCSEGTTLVKLTDAGLCCPHCTKV